MFINVIEVKAFKPLRDIVADAKDIEVTILTIKNGNYKVVDKLTLPITKKMKAFDIKKAINETKKLPIEKQQVVVARWYQADQAPMVFQDNIEIRKIMKDYYILHFAVCFFDGDLWEQSVLFSNLMLDGRVSDKDAKSCCF